MADKVKQIVHQMVVHRHDPSYPFWRNLYNTANESPEITKAKRAAFFKQLAAEFESKGREKPLALFIN